MPKTARSKSEYCRLTTQGANVAPPDYSVDTNKMVRLTPEEQLQALREFLKRRRNSVQNALNSGYGNVVAARQGEIARMQLEMARLATVERKQP
jgi:uncharacterized protein YqeY